MKQKDIAMVAVVAIVAAATSYFIANKLFVTPKIRNQQYQIVDPLSSRFDPPDSRFFNENSINPTRDTTLENTNQTPFNGANQ